MHVPQVRGRKKRQQFLLGLFVGFLCGYGLLMYMYGTMYEELYEENLTLSMKVEELEKINESLIKDQEKENEQQMSVSAIEIEITNHRQLKLDRLIVHQLSEMVKKEIQHIIGQDLHIISESDQLLISTIENKDFTIDDFTYKFEIKKLTITQTVKIQLLAKIS